jgi:hypothetical protein
MGSHLTRTVSHLFDILTKIQLGDVLVFGFTNLLYLRRILFQFQNNFNRINSSY